MSPTAGWPRITLVTPVRNSARHVDAALGSILAQGYPELEYIVVDGASSDGTLERLESYRKQLALLVSEPDRGMYDALNKGFAASSGEVMGWLSATDQLHPGALHVVGDVFRTLPEVEWITGVPTLLDDLGRTIHVGELRRWARGRFLLGANRYIMQEGTFWRRSLWQRAGGRVDDSRRIAADFELWVRFFRHARLYSVDALIGGYRLHADSIGLLDMAACHAVHDAVVVAELSRPGASLGLRALRALVARLERVPRLRAASSQLLLRALYSLPGPDLPPAIRWSAARGFHLE